MDVRDVCFGYGEDRVLDHVSLRLNRGSCVAITGRSGSGKSTLLSVLAGLIEPTSGTVRIAGQNLYGIRARQRDRLRLDEIGIVFQFGELIPELTLVENVMLPLLFKGVRRVTAHQRSREQLAAVALEDEQDRFVWQVSGGQQQRAALARALVTAPSVLLADEPTGALDEESAAELIGTLERRSSENGVALVVVTHSHIIAKRLGQRYELEHGRLLQVQS